MHKEFEWPLPPHHEAIVRSRLSGADHAPVLVEMKDGRRIVGEFIRMDPDAGMLEVHPERAAANIRIGFSSFKSVRLTELIELRPLALSGATGTADVFPASPRQKCTVNFKDNDCLMAETLGVVLQSYGLFLFLYSYGNNVLRWFIPADSIASYQIGEQLGKLLVDEKLVSADALSEGLRKQEQLRSQRLGDYLQRDHIVTRQQMEAALAIQRAMPQVRLGDTLIKEGLISREQLDAALATQARDRKQQLGNILVGMKAVDHKTIKRVLAQKLGIPYVNLSEFQFDLNLIKSLPGDLVRKHMVMPLYRTEARLVVALENPLATAALQDLRFFTNLKVDPVMASAEDLANVVRQFYGVEGQTKDIAQLVSELHAEEAAIETPLGELVSESDNTLVRLVNKIILDASEQGASDIHIESMPGAMPTRVRFRKDGLLSHYSDIPANFRDALISRLKIMSRLDISERRRSQDGKIAFEHFGPARLELRIVTMPTTDGLEDIVMRILSAPKAVPLDRLGLSAPVLDGLQKLAVKPHGLLFVCGPTGSGKTTTLHSLLAYINTPERKIWTVEDPVEITQYGLRQVQVQPRIEWDFASVLRSFLRADPDVIMVGETRDQETARIVVEASLTGHLVMSTMHTNSAAESIIRLLDFGLDPFNFADALLGVVGQRLVRRLCPACREPYAASEAELGMLSHEYCFETELDRGAVLMRWRELYAEQGEVTLYRPRGCKECSSAGYKGRLGVHEFLRNSAAIRSQIHARDNVPALIRTAMAEGMQTLKQDGIEKIMQGHTDWEQVKTV